MKNNRLFLILVIIVGISLPIFSFAADADLRYDYSKYDPWPDVNDIFQLVNTFSNFLIMIAVPLAVIFIIYAGILLLISGGDKSKITKARNMIWYTVLGFAALVIGRGFYLLIESILNLGSGR